VRFPEDHQWHNEAEFECKYVWGINNGKFFHLAHFKKAGQSYAHGSYDGKFIEGQVKDEILIPHGERIMIHNTKPIKYYSVPGNPWYDHMWGSRLGDNWDWVSIILNRGIFIMASQRSNDRICDFMMDDKTIESEFTLEGNNLYIHELGVSLILEPLKKEIIFRPKYGRPYSETPFSVIAKEKEIGFGIRERTYKEN
jgi:hypothetical protein